MAESNAVELAQAYVSLSISTKDMGKQILKGFGGAEKTAAVTGKNAGSQFAKAFNAGSATAGEGLEAVQKRIAAQAKTTAAAVKAARDTEAGAARKVAIEEAKLAEARTSGKAKASALLAAEDKLKASQLKLAAATDKTKVAAREMATQQDKATSELKEAAAQADKAKGKFANLSGAIKKAMDPKGTKGAFKGISAAADKEGKAAGKRFGGAFQGAAKGLLGAAALLGGLAAAKKLISESITEGKEAEKVGKTTAALIKASGGEAKVSAKHVSDLAGAISLKTGADDEAIQAGANLVLAFKNVRNEAGKGNDVFDRTTKAASDLSAAGFGSLNSTSKTLGKALNNPIKGMTALTKTGVSFTDQQKKQIKKMTESGDILGTQKTILKAVEGRVGGVAEANASMSDKTKVAADNLKEQLGAALLGPLEKVQKIFVEKVVPAVTQFLDEIKSGEGAGGKFKDGLNKIKDAIVLVWEKLEPLREAITKVVEFLKNNPETVKAFATTLGILAAAVGIVTGVQLLWNLAMTANPIGIIIVAIAALVAAIVFVVTHWDVIKAKMVEVWNVIKAAFGTAVQWVKDKLTALKDSLALVWDTIKAKVVAIWTGIKTAVVTKVQEFVAGVIAIVDAFKAGLAIVWGGIKKAALFVWTALKNGVMLVVNNFVRGVKIVFGAFKAGLAIVWNGIKTAALFVWNALKNGVLIVVRGIVSVATRVFNGWKAILSGIWNGIKNTVKTAFDLVKKYIVTPIESAVAVVKKVLGAGKGGLQNIFSAAKTAIGNIWDGLKDLAKKPIVFIIDTVINGLIGGFNAVAKTITGKSNTLATVSASSFGLSHGGIIPGHSRARDGDSIPAMVRPGEGWMVSEALQDPYERARFLAMNKAALRGRQSIRKVQQGFDGQGFASGGIVGYRGHRFTQAFAARLQAVGKRHPFGIYQGGFRPQTSYSGTSHQGDAVDAGPVSAALVRAFRAVGIAAWDRTGMGNWAPHIHGVPTPGAGRAGGQGIWQAQDYLRGGNGLNGRDNGAGSGGPRRGGGGFLGAFFDSVKSLVGAFTDKFAGPMGRLKDLVSSPFGELAKATAYKVKDEMVTKAKSYFDDPTGYAGGTPSARRGLHWVGEDSPELVNFRGGEQVWNQSQLGSKGITIHGGIHGYSAADVAREIAKEQRKKEAMQLW